MWKSRNKKVKDDVENHHPSSCKRIYKTRFLNVLICFQLSNRNGRFPELRSHFWKELNSYSLLPEKALKSRRIVKLKTFWGNVANNKVKNKNYMECWNILPENLQQSYTWNISEHLGNQFSQVLKKHPPD